MAPFPGGVSKVTINGEEYLPRPHEVNPELPEDMVWTQFPPNDLWLSDMDWYDAIGQDMITQRRIWAIPDEVGQVEAFRQLLSEFPNHALVMMFAVAAKGKPHILRFLLQQGVKATANEADGDDGSLVPLHAAAANGNLECVKVLIEEANLLPDTLDDLGGTPLMRACWKKHPEIVEYLLTKGADIMIRQTADPEVDEQGTNAFEFAVGGGCIDCAKSLIKRAEQLNLNTSALATRTALAVAAALDDDDALEMLGFVLKLGNYPLAKPDGTWEGDISSLTDSRKNDLEDAFALAVRNGQIKSSRALFAYIASSKGDGSFNWDCLKEETTNALRVGIVILAGNNSQDSRDAFATLSDILLDQSSRFTTPELQVLKSQIVGDAFFWACHHGCLDMVRYISSRYEQIDVNYLSRGAKPHFCSSLYIAAGNGHDHVVEYLFNEHGGRPAIHLGNGMFANGPTALWTAVWGGHASTAELLLHYGGPVVHIDDALKASSTPMRVIVTATKAFRAPVKLVSWAAWTEEHATFDREKTTGKVYDAENNEASFVVLTIEKDGLELLNRIELRECDDQLRLIEKDGRELKPPPERSIS